MTGPSTAIRPGKLDPVSSANPIDDLRARYGDVPIEELAARCRSTLDAAAKGDKSTLIFLRADKAVPYGELMEVMNLLRTAGYLKIALVGLEKVPGP